MQDQDYQNQNFEPQGFELLQELERNTPEEIRRRRAHFRLAIKSKVVISPGNAGEANRFRWQGVTGDISQGGCKALFPMPIAVGDIFRLDFREGPLGLSIIFARCIRCREVTSDAYEAGFRFFTPIALPESNPANATGVPTRGPRSGSGVHARRGDDRSCDQP